MKEIQPFNQTTLEHSSQTKGHTVYDLTMPRTRSGRPYIDETGLLSHDNRGYRSHRTPLWKFVEWNRVAWVLIPSLVLFVTNPGNGVLPVFLSYSPKDWIGKPSVTNYGFFSLEEGIEGVAVSALLSRTDTLCPFYDPVIGPFCGSFADSMCHRKPFFPWEYPPVKNYFRDLKNYGFAMDDLLQAFQDFFSALAMDRVHVLHRFLCAILVGSVVCNYCCPRFPPLMYLVFGNSAYDFVPLRILNDLWTSLFFPSSNLLRDLMYQNIFVYPALVELDRMIPKLRITSWLVRPTGNDTADFALALFFLVMILGGGSNELATKIVRNGRRLIGYSSVAGVGLGYLIRINTGGAGGILATFQRRDLSYKHAYWSTLAYTVVGHPNDWYPRSVLWLVAGFAGALFAEFQLKHVDSFFAVKNLLGYFGFA